MNIRDLEYFKCLCEVKSFTKTAEKLFISQPSVTMSVNRLEKDLGTKLVIRSHSNKEIRITESGIILKKRIDNILHEISEVRVEIDKLKSKKIKLGIPPIIGAYFFPRFVGELVQKGFIENIEFVQAGSVKMKELLLAGQVDIALMGSLEVLEDESIQSDTLLKDSFVMCISKNNDLSKKSEIDFSMFKDEQFIVLGDGYLHTNVLENLLKKENIEPQKIYYTNEIQTAKSLIAANLGVGIMVKMAVEEMNEIETIELKERIDFYISIVAKKEHYLTEIEKDIIKTIKEKNKEINER
ncbi:MAG: LysR family transcriptional regulator [Clostridium sp.]